ncbi:MAG: hypothetical protein HYZ31_04345 [Gammaproteobacteria bacterium]|nr:hypothetical protein [Gammaproteobacteria bacterium]
MTSQPQLPESNKLTVIYRIEPGCLGPAGSERVDSFCTYANQELKAVDAGFVNWNIVPRHDKSLPELQYAIAGKKLDTEKTGKYLGATGRNLADFENNLHEKMAVLIEQFLKRQACLSPTSQLH